MASKIEDRVLSPTRLSERPAVGYHVTEAWRTDSIRAQGLLPKQRHGFRGIYLFENRQSAVSFARTYINRYFPIAVVEINLVGLPIEPDPMQPPLPHAWRTRRAIGPEHIRSLDQLEAIEPL